MVPKSSTPDHQQAVHCERRAPTTAPAKRPDKVKPRQHGHSQVHSERQRQEQSKQYRSTRTGPGLARQRNTCITPEEMEQEPPATKILAARPPDRRGLSPKTRRPAPRKETIAMDMGPRQEQGKPAQTRDRIRDRPAGLPRSLAGKLLAGFYATPNRRMPVLYGMVMHIIRCNTHYFIDYRR